MAKPKSKKQTNKKQTGRLMPAAEHFRKLSETGTTQTQFEGQKEPDTLPPRQWALRNAGGDVRGLLRLGAFREYEPLLTLFYRGDEILLWQEFIKTLRKRAGLPYPTDWLQSYPEDCQLVADALEKEVKELTGEPKSKSTEAAENIKDRFTVEENRILFDGKDMKLPVGKCIEIATLLIKDFGKEVKYQSLDGNSLEHEAEDQLKTNIFKIRARLRACKAPCFIRTYKQSGYALMSK